MSWAIERIIQTFQSTFKVTKKDEQFAISVEDFYESCGDKYACMPDFDRYVFTYRDFEKSIPIPIPKIRRYVIDDGLIIASATNCIRVLRKMLILGADTIGQAFNIACIYGNYDAIFTLICGDFSQTRRYDFSRICPAEMCPLIRDFVRSCCVFNVLGKRYPWIDLHAFDAIDSNRRYNFTTIDVVTRNACIMRAIRNNNIARIEELEESGPYSASLAFAESCRVGNVELIKRYMGVASNFVEFGALITCKHRMYDALELLFENFWDFDGDTCIYYASRGKIDYKLLRILNRYGYSNLNFSARTVRTLKLKATSDVEIFERETQHLISSDLLNLLNA